MVCKENNNDFKGNQNIENSNLSFLIGYVKNNVSILKKLRPARDLNFQSDKLKEEKQLQQDTVREGIPKYFRIEWLNC